MIKKLIESLKKGYRQGKENAEWKAHLDSLPEYDFIKILDLALDKTLIARLNEILRRGVGFKVKENFFTWEAESVTADEIPFLNTNRVGLLFIMQYEALLRTEKLKDLELLEFRLSYENRLINLLSVASSKGQTVESLGLKALRETTRKKYIECFSE